MRLRWSRRRATALPDEPRASGPAREVARVWTEGAGEGRLRHVGIPADGADQVGRVVHLAVDGPGLVRPGDLADPVAVPLHGVAELVVAWQGDLEHRDSLGNRGLLPAPAVRLASGGGGLLSEVGPARSLRRDGGEVEVLTLRWIQPGPPATPTVRTAEEPPRRRQGRTIVTWLVAGGGAVTDPGGTIVARLHVPPGSTADIGIPDRADVIVWTRVGTALLGEGLTPVEGGALAAMTDEGGRLQVATRLDQPADVLVVATARSSDDVIAHGLIAAADPAKLSDAVTASRTPGFGTLPRLDG